MEKKVKSNFRGLDVSNYGETFNAIPKIITSTRNYVNKLGQEERNAVYGLLAEESAHTLLKMYQTRYESLICEGTIFEYEKGKTTEIDLIYLTRNMVYIIECKHRSEDIEVQSDGSFKIGGRVESPINQNLGHIRKLFNTLEYGNLVPNNRIFNIVFLLFNNAKMHNPITLFKKEGFDGAFAGHHNLLPLIHKIETERSGGKLPIKTLHRELMIKGRPYEGKQGMKKHLKNLQNRRY